MAPTAEQLDTMVRQMYGSDAWMLDIPEVKTVLEQAAQNLWDQATLESKIRQTNWWKTTSQSQQAFQSLRNTSPAELDFNAPGSQAQQVYTQIQQAAGKLAVGVDDAAIRDLTMKAMEFRWNDAQINRALAGLIRFNPGAGQNNAGTAIQQLMTSASDYFISMDPQTLQFWAQGVASGNQSVQSFNDFAKNMAMSKYQGAYDLLNKGLTMKQITDPYRQEAAKLMEVAPDQIDFQNNPMYGKILQYADPNTKSQRMMTTSEMNTYLRGTSQWGSTQQARDQVGQQVKSLLTTFGTIA